MITVCYWPDGCWCYWNERQQFTHRSDDFITIQVSLTMADEQIDFLVEQLVTFGE